MTSLGVRAVVRPNPTPTLSPFAGGVGFQVTMKTTLDDEADPPMVVVFTPLEGVASASHRIDKSRHLSDGTARTLSFARKQCAFSPKLLTRSHFICRLPR